VGPEEATKVTIKGAEGLNVVIRDDGLLPCPFCGGQAEIKEVGNAFSIFHTCKPIYGNDDDDVRMKIESRLFGSRSSAIKYWNRRS
jgi:hypothetical protein